MLTGVLGKRVMTLTEPGGGQPRKGPFEDQG
uniref:Uncharacterized protein n=1 Tax=Anguilla anguilla TaxID=7936 RepID=A0A0E9QE23_ANGAN